MGIMGIIWTIIVGLILGILIWKSPAGRFHPAGLMMSILGAMILIWAYLNLVK